MTKKVNFKNIERQHGKTDWNYLKKEEVEPRNDSEAPLLNSHQLGQMKKPKKM